MINIHLSIEKNRCNIYKYDVVTSGCVNAATCFFDFDDSWNDFVKIASFESAYGNCHVPIENGRCEIPNAIMAHSSMVKIGVIGNSEEKVITTTTDDFDIVQGANMDCKDDLKHQPTLMEMLLKVMQKGDAINISLCTDADSVALSLVGDCIVTVSYGDGSVDSVQVAGGHTFKHRYIGKGASHTVKISGCGNVTEFDAHGCGISEISLGAIDTLGKLVIYDNNVASLDISGLPALQYLHIFNNPLCENAGQLELTLLNLPDRTGKAFGSVIMYPFYPLGVLVYKNGNELTKYPSGEKYAPVEGEFYRDMNETDVKWYKYEGGAFVEQAEQNTLINLRIAMESDTLAKGWLFGSAIQYNEEEYAKCGYHFKQNHIVDYWESAERGLGLTLGMYDNIPGQIDEFSDMNVSLYANGAGEEISPREVDSDAHGDALVGLIAARGAHCYGIAPDCAMKLIDVGRSGGTYNGLVELITADDVDVISTSWVLPGNSEAANARYVTFGESHPLFVSAGNVGDGLEYTSDTGSSEKYERFGGNAFLVGSIDSDGNVSAFSATTLRNDAEYTARDLLVQYGNNISYYSTLSGMVTASCGTSNAAPICAANVLLMLNVYKKLNSEQSSYGKGSDFMDFVLAHTDPMYHEMNMAVGNGRPDLMYHNYRVNMIPGDVEISAENITASHGEGGAAKVTVSPSNAENPQVTYSYDMSEFAMRDGKFYPLTEAAYTSTVKAYSNMNSDIMCEFTVTVPEPTTKTYTVDKNRITREQSKVSGAKEFTIHALVQMPDWTAENLPADNDTTASKMSSLFMRFGIGDEYNTTAEIRIINSTENALDRALRFYIDRSASSGTCHVHNEILAGMHPLEDLGGKVAVFTMTVKGCEVVFYLNGTELSHTSTVVPLTLPSFGVNNKFLVGNDTGNMYIYEQCLSPEEVILNTIAILGGNIRADIGDLEAVLGELHTYAAGLIGGDVE